MVAVFRLEQFLMSYYEREPWKCFHLKKYVQRLRWQSVAESARM